ncbi:hypothetical protein [Lacipirellula parvula]|uniref:Probable pectate lyase C n=1 Tax=Lacipirellula parvula TaxID=2650471 RepID=A0A5K7XIB4_9BACT|nr:hypothetical protein [Lacipirellula parvula]BBO35802.1 hypothetical protein PLANPX_5414 [Lacipirellula parvula]
MPLRLTLLLAAALVAFSTPGAAHAQSLPAFAGADGAASNVTGGRGGLVYHVTKLDRNYTDAGVGTLRYGLSDSNFTVSGVVQPRTIVFDVAGTFWLGRFGAESGHDNGWDTNSRYNLGSHVTVAGQTAPGPVTIMGGLVKASGTNAILRNVTIAPGYGMRNFSKPEEGIQPTPGDFPDSYVYDAIDITGTNLMIDHVTTAYSTDETISANELANNVTIQYSNISQGQNYPQADAEASGITYTGHGLGSLLQGGSNAKFSIHHNLYAHQKGRLPRVGSEVGTGAFNDFRNNVFYNWFGTAGGGASGQPSFNNFVGNFYRAGPGGDNPVGGASTAITTASGGTGIFSGSNSSGTRVYHSGNLKDTNKDGDANDGVALANSDFGASSFQAGPVWSGGVPTYNGVTDTATTAYNRVLDYMGANWWTRDNVIDTLDERIIQEVRTGTGKIKAWADDPFNHDPNEGVEWRAMLAKRADPVTGVAPYNRGADWDVDGDGMPSFWELAHGLDPSAADNNGDFDADGYTNLEEYINDIAAWPAPTTIIFNGGTNQRYAQITNWDANPDVALTHNWQPSRYDVAAIQNGSVAVDAVGQHAGTLAIAPNAGNVATFNVTAGWIEVAAALQVGAAGQGSVNHSGGAVAANAITLGGSGANAAGVYRLSGDGWLRVGQLAKGANGGAFEFTGGTLVADVVDFSVVNQGGVISPGEWIGITEIHGDLTMQSGAIHLQIAAAATGGFDQLVVSGTLAAGGTLSIELVDSFVPTVGDSFDLLNFTMASGVFALDLPALPAGMAWDASDLLATGTLAVAAAPLAGADFNNDGFVNGDDLAIWRASFGSTSQTTNTNGDADRNGTVDGADFLVWQRNAAPASNASSAAVPEPAPCVLLLLAAGGAMLPSRFGKYRS